jgi:hypothetical protein
MIKIIVNHSNRPTCSITQNGNLVAAIDAGDVCGDE